MLQFLLFTLTILQLVVQFVVGTRDSVVVVLNCTLLLLVAPLELRLVLSRLPHALLFLLRLCLLEIKLMGLLLSEQLLLRLLVLHFSLLVPLLCLLEVCLVALLLLQCSLPRQHEVAWTMLLIECLLLLLLQLAQLALLPREALLAPLLLLELALTKLFLSLAQLTLQRTTSR